MQRKRQRDWDDENMHTTSCRLTIEDWCAWRYLLDNKNSSQHMALKVYVLASLEMAGIRKGNRYSRIMASLMNSKL